LECGDSPPLSFFLVHRRTEDLKKESGDESPQSTVAAVQNDPPLLRLARFEK